MQATLNRYRIFLVLSCLVTLITGCTAGILEQPAAPSVAESESENESSVSALPVDKSVAVVDATMDEVEFTTKSEVDIIDVETTEVEVLEVETSEIEIVEAETTKVETPQDEISSPKTSEDSTNQELTEQDSTNQDSSAQEPSESLDGLLKDDEGCEFPSDCASGFCYRSPYYEPLRCHPECTDGGGPEQEPVVTYCGDYDESEQFDVNCCGDQTCVNGNYCSDWYDEL